MINLSFLFYFSILLAKPHLNKKFHLQVCLQDWLAQKLVWIEIFIVVILIMLNYNPGKYLTAAMSTPFQELCCCCCSGLIYFVVFQKTFLYVYFWPRIASFFNQVTCTFLHYQNTYHMSNIKIRVILFIPSKIDVS